MGIEGRPTFCPGRCSLAGDEEAFARWSKEDGLLAARLPGNDADVGRTPSLAFEKVELLADGELWLSRKSAEAVLRDTMTGSYVRGMGCGKKKVLRRLRWPQI